MVVEELMPIAQMGCHFVKDSVSALQGVRGKHMRWVMSLKASNDFGKISSWWRKLVVV
jgi:hypothetical protein